MPVQIEEAASRHETCTLPCTGMSSRLNPGAYGFLIISRYEQEFDNANE